MDLIEDEPRQFPKPVPFCQITPLQPTVPEVSLLIQENFCNRPEKRNDSFSGTEFQTYNSWRWRQMNSDHAKTTKSDTKKSKPGCMQDCYLIKDKYFSSDVEKRKNEILYGELEEPRRPLPPRTTPVVPACIESFFSDTSLDNSRVTGSIQESIKSSLKPTIPIHHEDTKTVLNFSNQVRFNKESDSSEKLYSIISEQNKQLEVLQYQIEQLLKMQGVKDKQIEQLLNSQESKEKKIEQLLQCLDSKDKELELLNNLRDKQEQHVQELLKSEDNLRKENAHLMKKIKETKQKDTCSVGILACVQLTDASTFTSFDGIVQCNNKNIECSDKEITCLRDSHKLDDRDKSLSLHSSDLPMIQEITPSPQSSIHVDIQDFPDSSDDSESEADIPSNPSKEIQSSPLGYTFYNNVLMQVKDIIQNSGEKDINKESNGKPEKQEKQTKPLTECNFITEDRRSVQSFHAWDIVEKENIPTISNEREGNERISDKFQNLCIKDTSSPSDVSLKINALALKYLKQEQISEFGLQSQIPTPCQGDVTIYNVTNLSFGTMRYLDRYQMLPKVKESQKQMSNIPKMNEHSPAEILRRKKKMAIEENITSIGNILDITTLNQQPKLL